MTSGLLSLKFVSFGVCFIFFFKNWKRAQASESRLCPPAGAGGRTPPHRRSCSSSPAPAAMRSGRRHRRAGLCLRTTRGAGGGTEQATRRSVRLLLPQPLNAGAPMAILPPLSPHPRALRHRATRTCVQELLPKSAGP